MKGDLEHREITEKIIGAAFEVYRVLGYGFLESVYKKAMQVELVRLGLKCELEQPITVQYKGAVVGNFFADLLVNDVVLVELKIEKLQFGRRAAVVE
ncbi:MAG TPA: GxxExxY protein [Verrucomicrobiae bacterium]|nr:GxxExxY protein [Verrucomicrobiae bacterium]